MDQVPGLEQYGCGGEGRPGRHTAAACQYTSSQHPSRPIFTTQFFCRPVAGEHFVPTGISIEWDSRGRVRVGVLVSCLLKLVSSVINCRRG